MTAAGLPQVTRFLEQHAAELTRIWRAARLAGRPEVFPGLLDDVVVRFFAGAAGLLERGAPPAAAWSELVGVIRWPSPDAPGELAREWTILGELLAAVCESLESPPEPRRWLEEALAACSSGSAALGRGGERPRGVVTALLISPATPRPHPERAGAG